MSVCQICDYSLNLSTRKLVNCQYCGFGACRTCCETYTLNESIPKCMNNDCNQEWTRQFISSNFTSVFVNKKLKTHREEVLYERERALLPSTQPFVEQIIAQRNIDKVMADIREKIRLLYAELNTQSQEYYRLGRNISARRAPAENNFEFVRACPDSECRGFLSTQWKCGLCEKWACVHCHQIKGMTRDVEHTCDPDNVATAQLLAQNTKPCPNCHTGIYKIEGCNQMFCTQCHTGFDWRTGQIQTNIHNPHYFEWVRRNGGAATPVQNVQNCNELRHDTFTEIQNLLTRKHAEHPKTPTVKKMLGEVVRHAIHIRMIDLPRHRPDNYETKNRDLRIRYMMNEIDEPRFKILLQQNDKKTEKKRELYNVIEILLNTVTDIIFRFVVHLRASEPGKYETAFLDEIDAIVKYVNEHLADISKTYHSKLIKFTNRLANVNPSSETTA